MSRLVAVWILAFLGSAAGSAVAGAGPSAAFTAELAIDELGSEASLRLRLYYEPGIVALPPTAGEVVLVYADSARGEDAFFIPSDIAFEIGDDSVYRVEFEQVSDLLGQTLGGRVRPGESRLGFVVIPPGTGLEEVLVAHPESVTVRYAHHRAGFQIASDRDRELWKGSVSPQELMQGLNLWWEWVQVTRQAPPMTDGEARFFAERMFPGQGDKILAGDVDPGALRNAILRVGDRKLLNAPVTQRVAPSYPIAARQAGAEGLVIVLAYISEAGRVEDAGILSSNTVHLLNRSALSASLEWRFTPTKTAEGTAADGWRLLPFQFRLEGGGSAVVPNAPVPTGGFVAPRILKAVKPTYPEKAYRARVAGTVVYRATIDTRGRMVQAVLVEPVHPLLDEAALAALEQMLFRPATRDGKPVEADIDLPFTFSSDRP